MVSLVAGCGQGGFDVALDDAVKKVFTPRRTPQQYMLIAVSDADPDLRRKAVSKVAQSKKRDEEWAIKGFVAIWCRPSSWATWWTT